MTPELRKSVRTYPMVGCLIVGLSQTLFYKYLVRIDLICCFTSLVPSGLGCVFGSLDQNPPLASLVTLIRLHVSTIPL